MSEVKKPSIGRIVEFFPNGSEQHKLPNGMESAPAIITQCFGGHIANLTLFTANPDGESTKQIWSANHKDNVGEGSYYWDWIKIV